MPQNTAIANTRRSSAITDKYIDIELRERHKSAKRNQMGTI